MIGDPIPVHILALQMIANVTPSLAKALGLDTRYSAIGLISTDCDDATYIALDEATKATDVEVVYARSLYAGRAQSLRGLKRTERLCGLHRKRCVLSRSRRGR